MRGGTINKMTGGSMQPIVAWIQLHVHHIPAFEMYVTDLPFLSLRVTVEYKAAFLRSNKDHYFFAHRNLLSLETEKMF
jgi:hypothetical protein